MGRVFHERAVVADPGRIAKVEADSGVDTSVAEVAVQRSDQSMLGVEILQVAEVRGDVAGCDGRVLPARPVLTTIRRKRGRAEAALANLPELLGPAWIGDHGG